MQSDREIKLEFYSAKVSSEGGLLIYQELDEALGLTNLSDTRLADLRVRKNMQHTLKALLRQSVYSRLAGYEDTNDPESLRIDPTVRRVGGGRAKEHSAASTSEVSRFATDLLASDENLNALSELSGDWIDKVNRHNKIKQLILDMDSSESPTYGQEKGSAYSGHFGCNCYHPLFCFNQYGDLERARLRPGNVHSAHEWLEVFEPVVTRYRGRSIPKFFRKDAAFVSPDLYRFLEAEQLFYAIRLPANQNLQWGIEHLLTRPAGRHSKEPKVLYYSFSYQARSWDQPRRVVAKVEWHGGELFPRVEFIVTSRRWRPKKVVRFYNKRGTAEKWIKEGKNAICWTRLSCHDFRDNEVRLQLFGLAYNLGNFVRRLALPRSVKHWSLTTLREKLIKIGEKFVSHSRYITFQLAEVALPRNLFETILYRIYRLRLAHRPD